MDHNIVKELGDAWYSETQVDFISAITAVDSKKVNHHHLKSCQTSLYCNRILCVYYMELNK